MIFKAHYMRAQLEECSEILQSVAKYADQLSKELCGKELIITRVTDPVKGESGVHTAKRAFDARHQTETGRYYTEEESTYIKDKVNERFPRTDGKLTCMIHSFNGGMEHFHFQIPLMIPLAWVKPKGAKDGPARTDTGVKDNGPGDGPATYKS